MRRPTIHRLAVGAIVLTAIAAAGGAAAQQQNYPPAAKLEGTLGGPGLLRRRALVRPGHAHDFLDRSIAIGQRYDRVQPLPVSRRVPERGRSGQPLHQLAGGRRHGRIRADCRRDTGRRRQVSLPLALITAPQQSTPCLTISSLSGRPNPDPKDTVMRQRRKWTLLLTITVMVAALGWMAADRDVQAPSPSTLNTNLGGMAGANAAATIVDSGLPTTAFRLPTTPTTCPAGATSGSWCHTAAASAGTLLYGRVLKVQPKDPITGLPTGPASCRYQV